MIFTTCPRCPPRPGLDFRIPASPIHPLRPRVKGYLTPSWGAGTYFQKTIFPRGRRLGGGNRYGNCFLRSEGGYLPCLSRCYPPRRGDYGCPPCPSLCPPFCPPLNRRFSLSKQMVVILSRLSPPKCPRVRARAHTWKQGGDRQDSRTGIYNNKNIYIFQIDIYKKRGDFCPSLCPPPVPPFKKWLNSAKKFEYGGENG